MGDIFRELIKENSDLAKKVKSYMEKGALVPDDVVVEVLKQHLSKFQKEKASSLTDTHELSTKPKTWYHNSNPMS